MDIMELTTTPGPTVFQAWHDIDAEALVADIGHDDFVDSAASLQASFAHQQYSTKHVWLAVDDARSTDASGVEPDSVLGLGVAVMPQRDNRHLVELDLVVRPRARRQGVGHALWLAMRRRFEEAGRSTVMAWTTHRAAMDDDAADFARSLGAALEQTERYAVLALPPEPQRLSDCRGRAAVRAGEGYCLHQWLGPTPQTWLSHMAVLRQHMSTELPTGGLEIGERRWDAERVRAAEEAIRGAGRTLLTTVAEHVASGELVAFTMLVLPNGKPEVVLQEDTVVHRTHRGRRLGMLIKTANLELLASAEPRARRLHTWNAKENRHMLAINEALGFVDVGVEGAWQLHLD